MNYISDAVVEQTIVEMKEEIHHHLTYAGVEHLADEVNQIVEDTLRKVRAKYDL